MAIQPPRGTRDFAPREMIKRSYVIETIRNIYHLYGFDSLTTPGFESWELLSFKGAGEALKDEIYSFKDKSRRGLGLRFDLTTSLARFAANNPQMPKPLKVYQIGRVWRYDRPQAGRFREFWQADADIIGSSSLESEAECIALASESLKHLGFRDFQIRINSRKILNGIMEFLGIEKRKETRVFRSLDKLTKIGERGVGKELKKTGVKPKNIRGLLELVRISGKPESIVKRYTPTLGTISIAKEGLRDMQEVAERLKAYKNLGDVVLDFSLVRGLDYYTGSIFEILIPGREGLGSIAGGGRYDNLIENLGGKWTPAIGISFGIERLVEIMEKEGMFKLPKTRTEIFIVSVDESVREDAVKLSQELRKSGISAEIDLMSRGMSRQLDYVNKAGIPYSLILGPKEVRSRRYILKEMRSGTQAKITLKNLIKEFGKSRP
jgi:histidyl-tRNA synthetase